MHLFIHHSLITLSFYNVKSEIFKLSLNKPTILLTVRCVPIDKASALFGRFVTDALRLPLLLNTDCFFVIEDGTCQCCQLRSWLNFTNHNELQLSVCDNIIDIRQDTTLSIFLQLNVFRHNAKRTDKTTCDVCVFTLTFPDSIQGIDTKH